MTYDTAVIGAGVIGCAIARELTRFTDKVAVIDANTDVCEGTSKANSAIVHAGYDAVYGTKKAKMNIRGNQMMDRIAEELDVPFQRIGSLVTICDPSSVDILTSLMERGRKNGVPDLAILQDRELHQTEKNLADSVTAALYAPTAGIICPFTLTFAYAENASENGADFLLGSAVRTVCRKEDIFLLTLESGRTIQAKTVVNAAGVFSDVIHNQLSKNKIHITPRRGEYLLMDKADGSFVSHVIFQAPGPMGKGILVTPTVHGNLLAGPTAEDIADKQDTRTTAKKLAEIIEKSARSVRPLPLSDVITSFAGLRAHEDSDDFILGACSDAPGLYDAAGIESPGLSSAPAIGEEIADQIRCDLKLTERADFHPKRTGIPHLSLLPEDVRADRIRKNPLYGKMVCRCEKISEGEIVDAIRRSPGATTLDGVKRRVRAGMGRCQGGFCSPKVMEILSRELSIPETQIRKNGPASVLCYPPDDTFTASEKGEKK